MIEVRRYVTRTGEDVVGSWLSGLNDGRTRARVAARIDRLALGNFGDCKPLGHGLRELRLDFGPGFRLYYALIGKACVLLLCGGDKHRQSSDIDRAIEYLQDYRERTRKA